MAQARDDAASEQSVGLSLPYACDRERLPAPFIELDYDEQARAFVDRFLSRPHGALKSALYRGLRRFVPDYDAYGLLGMYPMHLISTAQARALLGRHARGSLLDIGAGSGGVTAQLAPLFQRVCATELSPPLARRLRRRGYQVLGADLARAAWPRAERFDVIACLNVLDRTRFPRSLLRNALALLAPGGRLLLSVPLPLRPHVQVGGETVDPEEPLPVAGAGFEAGFEAGVCSIARELLEPCAVRLHAVSRVPYLCRGDSRQPLFVLDAALFVCGAAPP